MGLLLFYVGENRYAIDNQYVLRIIPKVSFQEIHGPSSYMAGLLNLSGKSIPIVDFCQLIAQRPAVLSYHTRIILLGDPTIHLSQSLGVLGEKVTDTLDLNSVDFIEPPAYFQKIPFLNGIHHDEKGVIQKVNVKNLFKFLEEDLGKYTYTHKDQSDAKTP